MTLRRDAAVLLRFPLTRAAGVAAIVSSLLGAAACAPRVPSGGAERTTGRTLPTGVAIDPAGTSFDVGSMPLALALAPDGAHAALLLGGSREQGLQLVDLRSGTVTQTLPRASTFIGLAFARDGHSIYASGGDDDIVLRYAWDGTTASLADSIILAPHHAPRAHGTRYPAGLALSPDGRRLYVAENLGDSLAVVDLASRNVVQRVATGRYPYGVAVTPEGTVFVSQWNGDGVAVFTPTSDGTLHAAGTIPAGRHPSAVVLNGDGTRLFVASASTDRVAVIDTRTRHVVATLSDATPTGEGRGLNALALAPDGTRLFAGEGDADAVAVFELSSATAGRKTSYASDRVAGRIPVGWYPDALAARANDIVVVNGKGRGTAPNPDGPTPITGDRASSRSYTLSQTSGTVTLLPNALLDSLGTLTSRVAALDRYGVQSGTGSYPPITHVIYVIKENRTYDQVLGDLPQADGDTALVFFPRSVSPNHHALAERFGIFDRFFVNAEVSADGHNWSTAAYATDYVEKTVPSNYSGRGRSYDYEGTNRGFGEKDIPDDDVAEPANGYLWNAAERAGITFRDYGEFVVEDTTAPRSAPRYIGDKPFLRTHTAAEYPGFDLGIPDQHRADVWIADLQRDAREGTMPALEVVRLPNDHTRGASAGAPTPRAYMADNDLALGRMVEALSRTPMWRNTAMFVLEDDAQNGPDHVDSHRSVLLVISPYTKGGVINRFVNTTDVIATIRGILHLPALSAYDLYGRPLHDVLTTRGNFAPYAALTPSTSLTEKNPPRTALARESATLDFSAEDRVDDATFNRVLWKAVKGNAPYPGSRRAPAGVTAR